ncbi:hypothetical protein [Upsilontorquevirus viver2]|uniref:Capsid protein n=1 Tax=Paguma larvata torque teno virus TaxID=2219036 RepID=A0A348BSQ9_9VIRU|nr:hypothetical protein QKL49_gp3 [Paguma larvata torque teno virus]BBE36946.1 hypothetical protein [Paguma larvata torque teno virus]BBE36949.1 hypothetical protein [Paguma larvata torque teno virus]
MAFYARRRYRRHYRRPQRRHFHRRRRWWPRRKWRRHHHHWRRYQVIKEGVPRKKVTVICRGWEILGVIGSQVQFTTLPSSSDAIQVRRNIKNNAKVDYLSKLINSTGSITNCEFKDFCGGFGNASFTLSGLVQRNQLGMNRFSSRINERHWIRFLGGGLKFPPNNEIDFLFRASTHRPKEGTDREARDKWNHPAHLLNLPGTIIVESIKRTKCCRWKHMRFRPPTDFEGWYDLDQFKDFNLLTYYWTTIHLTNPMGLAPYTTTMSEDRAPLKNKWWGPTGSRSASWINRSEYDREFLSENETSWLQQLWNFVSSSQKRPKYGPFCPSIYPSTEPQTLWFMYYFKFQIGGLNIDQRFQSWPVDEYTTPPPDATEEIRGGELDASGWLCDDAFRRIVGADNQDGLERTAVLTEQQLKLYKLLYSKFGPQRRVRWGRVRTRRISPRRSMGITRRRARRQLARAARQQLWGGGGGTLLPP